MNVSAYAMAILSAVFGIGSIGIFTIFLYFGPFNLIILPLTDIEKLIFNTGLCFIFFMQHSFMVRPNTKRYLLRWIPKLYFAAVFSIISGIVLLILLGLWQQTTLLVVAAQSTMRWIMRGSFWAVLGIQFWALFTLKAADLFGIQVLLAKQPTQEKNSEQFLITGAYGWVRHPIYSTTILLIWLYPDLTTDRLLFNILFTIWIILGAMWEEQDLVTIHGETYRAYQRLIPMMIPYRIPKSKLVN